MIAWVKSLLVNILLISSIRDDIEEIKDEVATIKGRLTGIEYILANRR
jgi:hypothetical protein